MYTNTTIYMLRFEKKSLYNLSHLRIKFYSRFPICCNLLFTHMYEIFINTVITKSNLALCLWFNDYTILYSTAP